MNFLNATLLIGGLAAAIPLVLHLLGRREPKRIPFPAMRFITQRLQSHRRTMHVRRWVLLAMRAAMLAVLAFALAQPEIHRLAAGRWIAVFVLFLLGLLAGGLGLWAIIADKTKALRWTLTLAGVLLLLTASGMAVTFAATGPRPEQSTTAPAAVAILVDNSPTSTYITDDEQTRLEKAGELASWLLGRYPTESRFALLDRSARPAAFALDAATIQKKIPSLAAIEQTRPMEERIEAAVRLLRTSDLPRKSLFILSDLSAASWGTEADSPYSTTLMGLLAEDPPVIVHVLDIGSTSYRNRKLQSIELLDVTPAPESNSILTIGVREDAVFEPDENATDSATTNRENSSGATGSNRPAVTVELRMFESDDAQGLPAVIDGQVQYPRLSTKDRQAIQLDAKGSGQAILTLPPLPIGTHHGVVQLAERDRLELDNQRFFTVRVRQPRRILVVADDADERRVIGAMLNAYDPPDPRREYDIEFASTSSLADLQFDSFAAIGLFNPSMPPPLIRDRLDVWVRGGGQLFVALGPNIVTNWLQAEQPLGDSVRVDWPLLGNPVRVWRQPTPGTFLQVMQPGHPALTELSKSDGAPWGAFRIYHYWQLADVEPFSVIGRYAGTEHMALGESQVGEGRLLLMTTPLPALVSPADRWNDLGMLAITEAWPVYLILLQQIFEDLSGGIDAELNVMTGQPVVLETHSEGASRWQLFSPGSQVPTPLDSTDQILVPGPPSRAGNYWLRGTQNFTLGFSANLPAQATELRRCSKSDLEQLLGTEFFHLAKNRDEIKLAEGESSDGRPIYATIMLLLVGLFVLEQVLANRFYSEGRDATVRASSPGGATAA